MSEYPSNPCATCGACCKSYIVPVVGYDVWQISVRERLSPEQFLVAVPQPEPGLDGVRLSQGGPVYGLALDKRGAFESKRPCVFLVTMAGGHDRCGIYDHRPVVCQGYPMAIWSGVMFKRADTLCPPGSWAPDEALRPSWRRALQRFYMHMDIYQAVVARWNAHVDFREGARFPLPAYYSFLLNVYDRLAELTAAFGEPAMRGIEAAWPTVPRPDGNLRDLAHAASAQPWLDYYLRARDIIDSFYPELGATADLSLVSAY